MTQAPRFAFRICLAPLFFTFLFCITAAASEAAQSQSLEQVPIVKLLTPAENQVVIGKKPRIEIAFAQSMDVKSLLVMLDGIDISQIVTSNANGFSYQPIQVLEPGMHTLVISGTTAQGESANQEFSFSTRHYKSIEKGFSENELTVLAQTTLGKSDSREEQVPDKRMEANLRTTSQLKEKGFALAFNANLKFIDQDIPTLEPEKKRVGSYRLFVVGRLCPRCYEHAR